MSLLCLQVLEGFERGEVYVDLPTPVTIGREEDNSVQLNDERVSRFHAKIQEDQGRFILTDLDSTNGTRVNGHPVQMRVLRLGDQLNIGRSVLVFGSPEEIAAALPPAAPAGHTEYQDSGTSLRTDGDDSAGPLDLSVDFQLQAVDPENPPLFPHGPPALPGDLRPLQRAELSDLLAYIHSELVDLTSAGMEIPGTDYPPRRVDWEHWQRLMSLDLRLSQYLRELGQPGG